MSELKSVYIDRNGDWVRSEIDTGDFYLRQEADKVIAEITEGVISMFRSPDKCRGLDLKSPLGKIANIAFKHWNSVEFIQNKNTQLQKDKERLQQNNYNLLNEIEHLKENVADARQKACEYQDIINETERRERRQKWKRCLAMARWCDAKGDWYYSIGESFRERVEFYIKWNKRWLAIAEKFKGAK